MLKFSKSSETKVQAVADIPGITVPRYAGLNVRLLANLLDMILLMLLTLPFMIFNPPSLGTLPSDTPPEIAEAMNLHEAKQISDDEFTQRILQTGYLQQKIIPKMLFYTLLNFLVVGLLFVGSWKLWDSTPGKMIFNLKIVNDKDLRDPSTVQCIVRFLGYFVSMMPLFIGYFMIPFNKKKRGLHDYMAGTVVIYRNKLTPEWEKKKLKWQAYIMVAVLIISAVYLSMKVGK